MVVRAYGLTTLLPRSNSKLQSTNLAKVVFCSSSDSSESSWALKIMQICTCNIFELTFYILILDCKNITLFMAYFLMKRSSYSLGGMILTSIRYGAHTRPEKV